ncbi:MAG: hypothetical protein Q9221_002590 [Calogaya cf. arnoldii]
MSTPSPSQNEKPRLNSLDVAKKILPIQEIWNQPDASTVGVPRVTKWCLEEVRRWRVGCEDLIYRLSKQEQRLARSEMSTVAVGSKGDDSGTVFLEEMRKLEGRAREWHEELGRFKTTLDNTKLWMGR